MSVSKYNRDIAKYTLSIIGGHPEVQGYGDSRSSSNVDIGSFSTTDYVGVVSYATFGLSDYSVGLLDGDTEKEVRIELLNAAYARFEYAPNILATCAFNIINGQYTMRYGVIYPDVISEYYPDSEMKHMLFSTPYLWDNFGTLDYSDRKVTWLMGTPVSDEEFQYAAQYGSDVLMDKLEREHVDNLDIYRKSIL